MRKMPFGYRPANPRPPEQDGSQFDQFEATELYCPKCGRAVQVRKSLLLILPEGDKYEYRCQHCGTTVGDKIDRSGQNHGVLHT
jgi:DNA-directed RNA polymerase subunit RPC12/RpoP